MFFNKEDDKNAIIINNGTDLGIILAETSGFEFYITNKNVDYIICFNHHDCLSGCGTAKNWIADIKFNE